MGQDTAEASEDNLDTNETLDTEETETDEAEGTEGEDAEASGEDGEAEDQEGAEGSEGDGSDESGEVEIVLEGETQPQATTPRGFLKRINKLNGRVDDAQQETSEERKLRQKAEEERDLYKARISQLEAKGEPDALEPPDPEKFDGGIYDPAYLKAANEYNQKFIQTEIQKGIAASTQKTTVTQADEAEAQILLNAQKAHIERATKLGVKDYEATEDKAIEVLGRENCNHIIKNLDKSELLLYYLGKNPEVAEKYRPMLDGKQAIKALLELGGIVATIKVKKSGKSDNLPDPDNELEGGVRLKKVKGKGPTFE